MVIDKNTLGMSFAREKTDPRANEGTHITTICLSYEYMSMSTLRARISQLAVVLVVITRVKTSHRGKDNDGGS